MSENKNNNKTDVLTKKAVLRIKAKKYLKILKGLNIAVAIFIFSTFIAVILTPMRVTLTDLPKTLADVFFYGSMSGALLLLGVYAIISSRHEKCVRILKRLKKKAKNQNKEDYNV